MFYILSLVWILSISGLLVIVLKKKFGFVCTISFLLGSLVLYVFGFINSIKLGFYLSWVFVVIFWLIIIKWFVKKENDKLNTFKNNYLTIGLAAFIILCIYSFFLYKHQGFTYCDEFTHWGPMVIATIKANGFYAVPESLLTFHKDYPPLFSLLEVLWCGFDNFHFSETYCYIALVTFMFSCFLPVFDKLSIKNKKDWLKSIIIVISIVLVGTIISKTETAQEYAFVYNSIYTDWPLAVFSAYCIFVVYKEKEWNSFIFLFLSVAFISIILMKQMGLCFYLIILFYAFIKILLVDKKANTKKILIGIVCFVGLPVLAYFSWQLIIKIYNLNGQFVLSNMNFSDVLNIARGNTEFEWKHEAYWNFIQAIIHRPLVLHPFKMTYFVYVGILIIIIVAIYKARGQGLAIGFSLFVGACGYALTMLLLYMLAYDIDEAPRLASFDRYMWTYLYFETIVLIVSIFDCFNERRIIGHILCLGVLCLLIEPKSLDTIIPKTSIIDQSKEVLVVHQFDDFNPNREDLNGLRFRFNNIGYVSQETFDYEKWVSLLNDSELLYVVGYDDFVYNDLWLPLKQDTYLWNNSLYSIEKDKELFYIDYQTEQFYDYVVNYYLMEK